MNNEIEEEEIDIEVDNYYTSVDIELNIYPISSHGVPAIEISCIIQDKNRIKEILNKTFQDQDLKAHIILRNKWKALPKLARLGLIDPKDFE